MYRAQASCFLANVDSIHLLLAQCLVHRNCDGSDLLTLCVMDRNFLGEQIVRRIVCKPGVEVTVSQNVKDELQLSGNSVENVSQSCADINQICRVRNKDIRKVSSPLFPYQLFRNTLSADNTFSSWTEYTSRRRATLLRSKGAMARAQFLPGGVREDLYLARGKARILP